MSEERPDYSDLKAADDAIKSQLLNFPPSAGSLRAISPEEGKAISQKEIEKRAKHLLLTEFMHLYNQAEALNYRLADVPPDMLSRIEKITDVIGAQVKELIA